MIDYAKIAAAIEYYKEFGGFSRIEAPWIVSPESASFTAPPGIQRFNTYAGELVASGEVSFIELWRQGKLPDGKYQCVTPCYRDEPVYDNLHRQHFLKLELIHVNPAAPEDAVNDMIYRAFKFLWRYVPVIKVKTDQGYDLMCAGIELGSYGFREHEGMRWVYGTGIAEPRTTIAEEETKPEFNRWGMMTNYQQKPDKDIARRSLKSAGILDENGELAEYYRSKK